jgi:hypothetical protein
MSEQMTTGAREAIRIAESIFPRDLTRQRDLARQIIGAINLCEAEFAQEIIRRMGSNAPVKGAPDHG